MWTYLMEKYNHVLSLLSLDAGSGWKEGVAPIALLVWFFAVVWVYAPLVTSLPRWIRRKLERYALANRNKGGRDDRH